MIQLRQYKKNLRKHRRREMKRIKCTFENDKWGIYLTPMISISWNKPYGKCLWVGWLWWLWCCKVEDK